MSKQPKDDGNEPIPVLSYRPNGAQKLAVGATSVRSASIDINTRVVSLYSDVNCYFEVGDDSAVANITNSHYLPAGLYIDVSLGSDIIARLNFKYIAVISEDTGTLYLSDRI